MSPVSRLRAREALEALARLHGLPGLPVVSGATRGFRVRARLAIRGRHGAPKLGMFQLGTHRVVHIPDCSVHHPLINRVVAVVRRGLVDADVTSYAEAAHAGLARYLQVVVERMLADRAGRARRQQSYGRTAGGLPRPDPRAARRRAAQPVVQLELRTLQHYPGPAFPALVRTASVVERFGGAAVHYPPGAFGQNNLDIAERIVEHVRARVPEGARVAEFYAGVGAIGLSLLPGVSELRMNEVSPHSLQGMALGLADLDPASRARVEVVPGRPAQSLPPQPRARTS